ncbi:MAG: hypothetical protein IJC25_07515, partial [Clostridia bacterium]|nr:hypothetical protein [Clostridia bacterium]
DACGEWMLEWDETTVTLKVDGRQVQAEKKNHGGFNHCSIVFGPQGQLDVTGYHAHAQDPFWKTGIEY